MEQSQGQPPLSPEGPEGTEQADQNAGPQRIALVAESFYPATDGATTTVKAVADRLIDSGREVLIIAPGPGLRTYRRSTVARVRPMDKPGRQVRAALADFGPDLVHVTSPQTLGRKALKHAARLDVPTLTVQQSPIPENGEDRWTRKVADRSDLVVATCRWTRSRLADLGVPAAPVWQPGVDVKAFGPQLGDEWLHGKWSRKRSRGGQRVIVGYVGSLHKRHGVRRLVEVAQVPGVRLVVVGDGPQAGWLKERLPEAKFLGELPTGELATALATFDLLVHPGEQETCSHALREAAASGVPSVAPASGGVVDFVRPQRTGLLYDPADPTELRTCVAKLVAEPELRAELGASAHTLAQGRTWIEAVDELIEVHYPHTVRGHSRRARTPVPA